MTANPSQRRELIDQLAWQEAMGIDEVLLDNLDENAAVPLSALFGAPVTPTPASPDLMAPKAGAPAEGESASLAMPPKSSPESQPETLPETLPESLTAAPVSATLPATPATSGPPAVAPAELAGIDSLDALRSAMESFEGCALKHTASNMIFADGNPAARLMVVSEVPGRDEDRVGLPLVGGAGQLFDRMLGSIGISRADAYVTSLIPWRPPGNRTPTAEEMELLLPWLYRHIQLANPEFLLLLGGAPAKAMLPLAGGILKLRGRWHDLDLGDGVTRQAMATLHPSYLVRSPAQKRLAYADLLALAAKLG